MKSLELSNDEYELIMKLRESRNKAMSKSRYDNFEPSLQRELERQERNMKKIASLKFETNPQEAYHNAVESSYHRKIRKTVTENGKVYEVTLEDIGDGNGLVEKERKELGKANNINYRFSEMSNNSGSFGSQTYSKMIKTETNKGKKYEVTYEDKGDGMVEINRELISNANSKKTNKAKTKAKTKTKGISLFDTNNIETEFFKMRNNLRKNNSKKNNRGSRIQSSSYKKKTVIENVKGEAYKVTYENVNNEGFKEVKREKI